jgi:prefoldin subunit 5
MFTNIKNNRVKSSKKIIAGIIFTVIFLVINRAWSKEVPYTLEDRDRLIRVETRLEGVDKRFEQIDKRFEQIDKRFEQIDKRFEQIDKRFEQIDKRFEQVDKRFEQVERRIERLENIMMWGFGLLFTGMMGLVGFVLWDRRTALAPAIRKNKELEEREERLEHALKEYAFKNPELAEILRHVGLL